MRHSRSHGSHRVAQLADDVQGIMHNSALSRAHSTFSHVEGRAIHPVMRPMVLRILLRASSMDLITLLSISEVPL